MKLKQVLSAAYRRGLAVAVCFAWLVSSAAVYDAGAQAPSVQPGFHSVDLAPFVAKVLSNAPAPKSWSALPRGRQTFGGVPFQVDGKLEVTGIEDASNGEFHPPRLGPIPVGRKTDRVHLLHGAVRGDKDGVPLARVVFHYSSGEQRSIRLAYGVHARNWMRDPDERSGGLIDPDSRLAWSSANDDAERPGASFRLFQTALTNPQPDLVVQSLEFVSLFSRATPFIAAITAETGPVPAPPGAPVATRRVVKKSMELEDAVYHDEFVIRAIDSGNGQLLTNAHAALTISNDEAAFYFGEARADATGTIRLPFPPQQTVAFTALVRAPGRVPLTFSGNKTNGGDFARNIEARLAPGVRIGGIVSQTGGRPIADAEVVVYKLIQQGPREYTRIDHETVRTGQDGRWTCTSVPADLGGFHFQASHPEHRTMNFATTDQVGSTQSLISVSAEQLRSGVAKLELPPAIRVVGVVTDNSGQPAAGAELHLVDVARAATSRVITTDRQGAFSFSVPEPGELNLMIQAPGCRPKFQTIQAVPNLGPLSLSVAKAQPFRGRVVDQNRQPVAGAKIRLDSWNGTRLLQWQTLADDQGRFVWETPVEGNAMFQVTATNHTSSRMSFNNPSGESTMQLRRLSRVVGRVIDADTRKPIDEFTLVRGRTYNYDEPMRWDRYDTTRGRRGEYVVRLDDYSSGSGGGSQIMVEAPGYVPAASAIFTKPGLYTNNFELKRGRGIGGVVQMADGTPVANATVVLVERSDSAYMERSGELRRGSGGEFQRSNLKGQFEFAPKLEPHTILAVHQSGYAEVRASNVVAGGKIVLQAWGRVKGTLRVSPLPERDFTVSLQSESWRYGDEGRTGPPLSLQMKAELNAQGEFVFDRVPPGERRVVLQFKLNDRENARTASSHGTPVTVVPGQTAEAIVGGEGRTVIGRVTVVGGDPEDVDWRRDVHTFQSNVNIPVPISPPAVRPNMTEDDQRKAHQEYNARLAAFWRTEQGRALQRAQRSYVPLFDTNGTFRIGNVVPGDYSLYLSVTNPDRPDNYYEHIGSASKQVTVPSAAPGREREPFDMGAVELQIRGTTRVGKRAPAFEVKTFDGKPVKLADYKGKYVLLDFWATWAGARTLDLQILKALHEAYGKDERLVMVGLNFDHDAKLAGNALAQGGMKWTQGYAGGWGQTSLAASFGVQGLPEVILIDPEGKIAAKNLRGSTIRNTVRNHLSAPRTAGPALPR